MTDEKPLLKVTIDTAFGTVEHTAMNTKIDGSGVLAVGDGKQTDLYAPGFWVHAHVTEVVDNEAVETEEETKESKETDA